MIFQLTIYELSILGFSHDNINTIEVNDRVLLYLGARLEKLGIVYEVFPTNIDHTILEYLWEDIVDEYNLQSDWFNYDASWVLDEGIELITFLQQRGYLED